MIEALLKQEGLQVEKVHRDGPRYWVGQVHSPKHGRLMLKAVTDNQPWVDPHSGKRFQPSDQLRAEADVLEALGEIQHEFPGAVPAVAGRGGDVWVLRKILPGRVLGGPSSFQAEPSLFEAEVTLATVDFVMSLQAHSRQFESVLAGTVSSHKSRIQGGSVWYDLNHPAEPLIPYAQGLLRLATELEELHDSRIGTFVHGELYPGHVVLNEGKVGLIDWENAGLGSPFADFATLWWRGFESPEWQERLVAELEARGVLRTSDDRALWLLETALQAAGNLTYLHWSTLEPPELRKRAARAMRRHLEQALA